MTLNVQVGMPLEQFLEETRQQPFELINGEKKLIMPTVLGHSEVIQTLFIALYLFVTGRGLGRVYSETTFILPDRLDRDRVEGSRTPDVMVYLGERVAQYQDANPDWRELPLPLVPDLVVEVVSPNDRYSDVDEKVDVYLADGVRLIWVVDPQRGKVHIHVPGQVPQTLKDGALPAGGAVLPEFSITLADIFKG